MASIWSGADPGNNDDFPQTYELGSVVEFFAAGTLDAIRVYSPGTRTKTARRGHVWAMNGALLDTVVMTDVLPAGWSTHNLPSPRTVAKGEFYVVSYETAGDYGATAGAFASTVLAADGNAGFPQSVAVGGMAGTNGNGRFNTSHATFPNQSSGAFYGVDIGYTVAGGVAPVIGSVVATPSGLDVQLAISATDADTLTGAVYVVDWGDGQTSNGSISSGSATPSHTYASGGVKAILISVTDNTNLSDYAAVAVELVVPGSGLGVTGVLNAIVSHALASGLFESVNTHEPKAPPGNGLHAAVWSQEIQPVRSSGLASSSARVAFMVRIYSDMLQEPQDAIDPNIMQVADTLMAAYSADFQLGGTVRQVDLLGGHGVPLSARAGYLNIGGKLKRVMDITLPVVINDSWSQSP